MPRQLETTMESSTSISLARAKGFGPLPALLEARAGERALLDTFEGAGVPFAVIGSPDTPIPMISMLGLFARSARYRSDRTFGLEVGRIMSHRGYGLWVEHCVAAPTLGEALRRSVATSWAQVTVGRLELQEHGRQAIWRYLPHRPDGCVEAYSDHLIPPMLDLVRLYLGADWLPPWVEVNYPRDSGARRIEECLGLPVLHRAAGVGFCLERRDLLRGRRQAVAAPSRIVTLREVVADAVLASAPEPARSLSAIVAMRLLDGRTDIDGTARLAGMSVQGLQRRLRQKGDTYREVVEAARKARALALLQETDLRIVDVALQLGYEDHASFTRAFKRWYGYPPSEWPRAPVAGPEREGEG